MARWVDRSARVPRPDAYQPARKPAAAPVGVRRCWRQSRCPTRDQRLRTRESQGHTRPSVGQWTAVQPGVRARGPRGGQGGRTAIAGRTRGAVPAAAGRHYPGNNPANRASLSPLVRSATWQPKPDGHQGDARATKSRPKRRQTAARTPRTRRTRERRSAAARGNTAALSRVAPWCPFCFCCAAVEAEPTPQTQAR